MLPLSTQVNILWKMRCPSICSLKHSWGVETLKISYLASSFQTIPFNRHSLKWMNMNFSKVKNKKAVMQQRYINLKQKSFISLVTRYKICRFVCHISYKRTFKQLTLQNSKRMQFCKLSDIFSITREDTFEVN